MSKLREMRQEKKPKQIRDTGIYAKNIPLSNFEEIPETLEKIRKEFPTGDYSDDEAFIYHLFDICLVDKKGHKFEDIESPDSVKEALDVSALQDILRFFGLAQGQVGNLGN